MNQSNITPASIVPAGLAQLGTKIRSLSPVISAHIDTHPPITGITPVVETAPVVKRGRGRPRKVVEINQEHLAFAKSIPKLLGKRTMREAVRYAVQLTKTRVRADITPEKRAAILRDLADGRPARVVAQKYKISISTAHAIANSPVTKAA